MVQVYGGWLTDAGSYLGKATRGILDIAGQALHVAQGGGTDLVSTSPTPKTDYVAPALIAGGVVMVALMLTKKKRR